KQLKKKFPPENPFRRTGKVLPSFRAKINSFQRRGSSKAMLRLKALEKYCGELLSCDPSVTQSFEVVQFFQPQNRDLEPDYAKNSFVIMPSDDIADSQPAGDEKRHSAGSISQPFVTETYRCVATYETKDTKNRPFRVAVNDTVDVLIKDKAGWWLVENDEKHLAWFPAPFLERCEEDDEDEDNENESASQGALHCVVRNYQSSKDDELSVNIGAKVQVLQKSDNGWWLVRHNSKAGYVPFMYLQPYTNPHLRLQALQKDMRSSTLSLTQLHFPESGPQESLQLPSHKAKESRLKATLKQKSRSMELLPESNSHCIPPISEEVAGPTRSLSTDSEDSDGSEGSQFSFNDEGNSSGSDSDSVSTGHIDGEEQSCAPQAESRSSSLTVSIPPKMPPRPRPQEIFSRCTTMTRKAALTYKANLFEENGQSRVR
ncbi:NADPH oxidase organizer 1-like, partial [Arapaima gigas]